jgi:methanogenic corrinoid protein MtbC1
MDRCEQSAADTGHPDASREGRNEVATRHYSPSSTPLGERPETPAARFRAVDGPLSPRRKQELHPLYPRPTAVSECLPTDEDVVEFTGLVLDADMPDILGFLDRARASGMTVEGVYIDLLAPAARRLGDLWMADQCSFAEVTMAMARLQVVLREVGPSFRSAVEYVNSGRRLLLSPAVGEQHTFGLLILAELFVRAGWDVWGGAAPGDDVVRLVRDEWFDVVGLSVGCSPRLDSLAAEIRRIRAASRNRSIGVMVGGTIFSEHPELVAQVGADATAVDGRDAPRIAAALGKARASPC